MRGRGVGGSEEGCGVDTYLVVCLSVCLSVCLYVWWLGGLCVSMGACVCVWGRGGGMCVSQD